MIIFFLISYLSLSLSLSESKKSTIIGGGYTWKLLKNKKLVVVWGYLKKRSKKVEKKKKKSTARWRGSQKRRKEFPPPRSSSTALLSRGGFFFRIENANKISLHLPIAQTHLLKATPPPRPPGPRSTKRVFRNQDDLHSPYASAQNFQSLTVPSSLPVA